ncbi:ABC transporter permease [Halomonas salipaludis]|uniref:Polyamine ABC transporter permease n=1 Tax=Halomonas salipaludis TaxID=2032625 RepID=A0A2A2ERZ8_9GAMM|nr:ABC transporter permease [Halomonas salipaludis]PAU75063.1 polyamine ABC transporter permease [Halomonas salipaludis]
MNIYRAGWLAKLLALVTMGFLMLPLMAVIPVSFTGKRYLSMPEGDWSLRHYASLLSSPEWLGSLLHSSVVAVCAALLATLLATAFVIAIWYRSGAWTRWLIGLCMLPLIVPPVVSAMVLYFMTTRISRIAPGLGYDSLPGVILAHTLLIVPFGVINMLVAISRIDRRIELASRNLGASLWQTTWMVILPNLRLAMLTTFLLCFVLSWEEIAVTLFITSWEVVTLPRQIWGGLRDNVDPVVAAISTLLIGIVLLLLLTRMAIESWREARRIG